MKNFVQPGKILPLPAPYLVTSGQGALIGATFGVACTDIASGVTGEFMVEGVFTLAKATGASTNVAVGGRVYWDNTARLATGVSTDNTLIGTATAVAAVGDTTITVRLVPTI